ncbi:MAG: hypothetical protein AB3N14_08950 [Flavobacteriaceae bacterium]
MKTNSAVLTKTVKIILVKIAIGLLLISSGLYSCKKELPGTKKSVNSLAADSLALLKMIQIREKAMISKDIAMDMQQFSDHATWINSQGYYFEGKENVRKFHGMLAGNDSLDYYYEAGKPRIRMIDSENALAYYGWKMFWYKKAIPTDTTFKEIGLMTLNAHKDKDQWQWTAVTNQHTPWFYENIEPVTTD